MILMRNANIVEISLFLLSIALIKVSNINNAKE